MAIRTSMLTHCPNIRIHSNLVDANIYIFANWCLSRRKPTRGSRAALYRALELLDTHKFSSVKNDLVPFLVRKQHRSTLDGIPNSATQSWADYKRIEDMTARY